MYINYLHYMEYIRSYIHTWMMGPAAIPELSRHDFMTQSFGTAARIIETHL